jgi:hypothetical protein
MTSKIVVLVDGDQIKCYHNIRHLCDNHADISYFKVYRALLKSDSVRIEGYLIGKTVMRYITGRKLPKKGGESEY